ncbi:hypothetical protein RB594_000018 [Gaeumannomyces avenae]
MVHLRSRRLLIALPAAFGLLLLAYALTRLLVFLAIFGIFRPHAGIAISQPEIALAHDRSDDRVPVVPKITHQIFHAWEHPGSTKLPPHWEEARRTCQTLNPDWDHKIWYTDTSRAFLAEHYPWFLPTYDGYKFPIQRVDVLRYFLLRHYGGIYLDLDNGCAASLDPLTYYPAFTTDGGRGALSNNIMGGQPGHPLLVLLTEQLPAWDWNYFLPYVIISYTSGQWFVTAMWERYHWLLLRDGTVPGMEGTGWRPLHHVLMEMRPGADAWVFFTQVRGGTWSNWDSHFFPWLGDHLVEVGVAAMVPFLAILTCVWCARRSRPRYRQLAGEEHNLG